MDMERFLRYSLERDKPIRVIFIDPEGKLCQGQAVVEKLEEDRVSLYVLRPPRRLTIPAGDVLGAAYTAKDEG